MRKLAQFGFVEEVADPSGHHRARRWQAAHKTTSWSNTQLAATAEGREVVGFIHRRQVQTLTENLERFHSSMAELPEPWVEAFGNGDMISTLTHESLNALWDNFYADLDSTVRTGQCRSRGPPGGHLRLRPAPMSELVELIVKLGLVHAFAAGDGDGDGRACEAMA